MNWSRTNRLLVIGTFHNPNWFYSHIKPLAQSGFGEVILVCDHVVGKINGVRYSCPPRLLTKLFSRAVGKFIWTIVCSFRFRPDVYMGYHIFPAAVTAIIAAKLFNRPSCYQDTSGPLELEGGGWHAENRLLTSLGKESPFIERLVLSIVRRFDLVVVRGNKAKSFIQRSGYKGNIAIITGSVELQKTWLTRNQREIDMLFVGRLTEYKRPDRYIDVLAKIAKKISTIKAVVVGDGPDLEDLKNLAVEKGVSDKIQFLGKRKDVVELMGKSKVFVLTSRWEGVSIAMIEAMTTGAVPVVFDVGDLGDFIINGKNGYVVKEGKIDQLAQNVMDLLSNQFLWDSCSKLAVTTALERSSVDKVSKVWYNHLTKLVHN